MMTNNLDTQVTINLIENSPNGIIECNYNHQLYQLCKFPIESLQSSYFRSNKFKSQSIFYLLLGQDKETSSKILFMGHNNFGQEYLVKSIKDMMGKNKQYEFVEAVAVIMSQANLTQDEFNYIKQSLVRKIRETKRYKLKTKYHADRLKHLSVNPELDRIVDTISLTAGTLGMKVFVPKVQQEWKSMEVEGPNKENLFYYRRKPRGHSEVIEAYCTKILDLYILLEGSKIYSKNGATLSKEAKIERARYKNNNWIKDDILQKNAAFDSISALIKFVMGKSSGSAADWVTEQGMTLQEFEALERSM